MADNGNKYGDNISTFDLQQYLCSKDGDEWLQKVAVKDVNGRAFRYYAPQIAWEDIQRHDQSSYGDFIFDVIIKMKNESHAQENPSNAIRYVLRPQNMKDPITLQSTKAINIPIGNYNGDELHNVRLIDLLSKPKLLQQIGLNCKLSGSLYEPLLDEPAHCLPDIECICGASMKRMNAEDAYPKSFEVYCNICGNQPIRGTLYHCPKHKAPKQHRDGYDICQQCAGLQIRTFIEKQQSSNDDMKMNDDIKMEKQDKYGKGGIMFSTGCGLLAKHDASGNYEVEIFLHKSRKYRNGKCLCIITTSEGSTANIIEQGFVQKLKFAKNKKECDWGIDTFDTSTKKGRINQRTGKSAETDMIIYFIPVQEDIPRSRRRRFRPGGFLGAARPSAPATGGVSHLPSSPESDDSSNRSRSRSRERSTSEDESDDSERNMRLKFAKHKMTVSDRDFNDNGMKLRYPLKRIRELPIRSFLRGAVFFDQTRKPNENDAERLNNYLQSRYNDNELLSIHSYSVLIKQRAKLLPVSDEYYKKLNELRNKNDGIYDLYFTQHAKDNNESCVVCMDNWIDCVMVDCYHMCLCMECGKEWRMSCPICRNKITKIVKEDELNKNEVRIIPMAVSD